MNYKQFLKKHSAGFMIESILIMVDHHQRAQWISINSLTDNYITICN